ncbi:hypothetical protein M2422_004392 [Enterobacter sp. SLBN-59]|nr:hypothetical protein [Enterobacter sp. SLBN-59]
MGGSHISDVYEIMYWFNIEDVCLGLQAGELSSFKYTPKKIFAAFMNYPKKQCTVLGIREPMIESDFKILQRVSCGEHISKAKTLLDSTVSVVFWNPSYLTLQKDFEKLAKYEPVISQVEKYIT